MLYKLLELRVASKSAVCKLWTKKTRLATAVVVVVSVLVVVVIVVADCLLGKPVYESIMFG